MRRALRFLSLVAALGLALAACGGPADVAGDYTLNLTNGENGCAFDGWEVGESTTGVPLTITQDGGHVTATLGGAVAIALDLWLGSHSYSGEVDGSHLSLVIYGTRSGSQGSCTYTLNSYVEAEISGDLLTGEVRYTAATNDSPDCGSLEGCNTRQDFNGTRPPQG